MQTYSIIKFAFLMTSQFQQPGFTARLAHLAFVMYVVSYALPAVVIAGDLLFGFLAALLSFAGSVSGLSGELERGQFPACVLGASANVLMVCSYICYNLRRYSHKWRPSFLLASRLSGLATIFALGAAIFLANGSESFDSHIGYFVWLASMMLMSIACWQLARAVRCEQDASPNVGPAVPDGNLRATEEPPSAS